MSQRDSKASKASSLQTKDPGSISSIAYGAPVPRMIPEEKPVVAQKQKIKTIQQRLLSDRKHEQMTKSIVDSINPKRNAIILISNVTQNTNEPAI